MRAKWQKFRSRNWTDARESWLANVPSIPKVGAKPEPGIEQLPGLLALQLPEHSAVFADVAGLRSNALSEAIFLFQKCSHTALAAQRLGQSGMHSWCAFNAYHSAYLGARGIMALLGVLVPNLKGAQVGIDLFPEIERPKRKTPPITAPKFEEFLVVRLPMLEQRYLWMGFQRILRLAKTECCDENIKNDILDIDYEKITPPRNHFLYRYAYWPLDDLMSDFPEGSSLVFATELDPEANGFLIRLSFAVYRLFEQLVNDLASYSGVVKQHIDASRFIDDGVNPELAYYREFVETVILQTQKGS